MHRKIIVSCAVTGAIHTPSMSQHLPVTAAEIAEASGAAAEAGAAIIHLHARNPNDGRPDQSAEAFEPFLRIIKQHSDAVVNITTGGAPTMCVDERLQPARTWRPEVASLNMGSMNFGLFPLMERFEAALQHEWEREYLGNRDIIFRNSYGDIERIIKTLSEHGTRFEFECYDTSHLYNLKYFYDRGLVRGPLFIQGVFGLMGGIGTHPEDVFHMKRTADRLFGNDFQMSMLGAGRHQFEIASLAITLGCHIRVGLEDSLWLARGQLAQSNAEQVSKARKMIEAAGLEIATPSEAREMLSLKGGEQTGF